MASPKANTDSPISNNSNSSDDSSVLEDVSFEYVYDSVGEIIRHSRGGGRSTRSPVNSSPPTPQDDNNNNSLLKPPSITSPGPLDAATVESAPRRSSLSRSESAYPVLMGGSTTASSNSRSTSATANAGISSTTAASSRALHRTTSGPIRGPTLPRRAGGSSGVEDLQPRSRTAALTGRDSRPSDFPSKQGLSEIRARLEEQKRRAALEEKENLDALAGAGGVSDYDREDEDHGRKEGDAEFHDQHNQPSARSRHDPVPSGSAAVPIARSASFSGSQPSSGRPLSGSGLRPLADAGASQRPRQGPAPPSTNALRRLANKTGSKYPSTALSRRITEAETEPEHRLSETENQYADAHQDPHHQPRTYRSNSPAEPALESLSKSGSARPRRSASLSEGFAYDEHGMLRSTSGGQSGSIGVAQRSRPGSSQGHTTTGDTVTPQDDVGPKRMTVEEANLKRKHVREEAEKLERQQQVHKLSQQPGISRKSPSPTHLATSAASGRLRTVYGHKRRDSDTLRSGQPGSGIPTVGSPSPASTAEPSAALPGRNSPSSRVPAPSARHRRSPTAPEPPTTSGLINPPGKTDTLQPGKAWAAGAAVADLGSEREKENARERDKLVASRNPPPVPTGAASQDQIQLQLQQLYAQQQHQQQQHQQQQQQHHVAQAKDSKLPATIIVNKKPFYRLDLIGKGGSSRVFRVLDYDTWEMFAIKRVSLDKLDAETFKGYTNEISLLKRLEGNARIIRLYESEMKPGNTQGSKGYLVLLMELGEIDMAKLLSEQMKEPPNMVWVAYYWQQMLQAVQIIHDEKIVHSDLKPANFVLVKGQLKLIDFGIANAIANDTTNIQRDHHMGTVNYMSPEAIEGSEGNRKLKVGRPSDVWSLGCILYQMVYGQPPFGHLSMYQKMKAIPDTNHKIEFPEFTSPPPQASPPSGKPFVRHRVRQDVIDTVHRCLKRNPKERATIPELLELDWLTMRPPTPVPPPVPVNVHEHLASDETVINPHFMLQLLQYGVQLGQQGDPFNLESEAMRLIGELKTVTMSL